MSVLYSTLFKQHYLSKGCMFFQHLLSYVIQDSTVSVASVAPTSQP